jgi:hypothetical protein
MKFAKNLIRIQASFDLEIVKLEARERGRETDHDESKFSAHRASDEEPFSDEVP